MACSGVNRMDLKEMEKVLVTKKLLWWMSNYKFIVISSIISVLSDSDCKTISAFPCFHSALEHCPKCGSHTAQ